MGERRRYLLSLLQEDVENKSLLRRYRRKPCSVKAEGRRAALQIWNCLILYYMSILPTMLWKPKPVALLLNSLHFRQGAVTLSGWLVLRVTKVVLTNRGIAAGREGHAMVFEMFWDEEWEATDVFRRCMTPVLKTTPNLPSSLSLASDVLGLLEHEANINALWGKIWSDLQDLLSHRMSWTIALLPSPQTVLWAT